MTVRPASGPFLFNVAGLLANVAAVVVGQLAGEVDGVVVDDHFAVALFQVQALDRHWGLQKNWGRAAYQVRAGCGARCWPPRGAP